MSAMGLVTTLPSAVQQANLSLDFVNQKYSANGSSKTLSQAITFSRSSTGTYFDASGIMRTAAVDTARFEYDPITKLPNGFLAEDARVNMTNYSSTFANSAWAKTGTSLIPNQAVAPDGTLTADKLVEDTTTAVHFASRGITVAISTTYTWSIFVKAAERSFVSVQFGSFANQVASNVIYVNLLTGSVTTTDATRTRVQALPNGWFRISTTVTTSATGTTITPSVYVSSALGVNNYAGNGTSGIYIWGGSMELGAFPTSHIPTPAVFTSRASTATYFNSSGVMQTAAVNVARSNAYGRDSTGTLKPYGLLTEAAGTNLVLRSAEFDNASWGKSQLTVTANGAVAPDGTTTMDLLVPSTVSGTHSIAQVITATASTAYVLSVYVKAGGYNYFRLRAADSVAFIADAVVNLATGVITNQNTTNKIESVGNGIYRVSVFITTAATATNVNWSIWSYDNTAASTFAGDGVSGVYAWGAQLETGAFATSYIPTTTAAVTRAADVTSSATGSRAGDVASVTLDPAWFNSSEFSICSESQVFTPRAESAVRVYEMSTAADNNNRAGILYNQSLLTMVLQVVAAGTTVASLSSASIPSNSIVKTASAVKLNDFAASFNGAAVLTDTSGAVPTTMDKLYIACFRSGINQPNGYIRTIQVFNRRLSNTVLQVLSS